MSSDVFQPILEVLEKSLTTKQVFGEPLEIGGVTMVPLMDLMFGFGGGGDQSGTGSGGGAGARLAPKAIIVISEGKVSVLPVGKSGALDKIIEAVPGLVEQFKAKQGEAKA